MGLCTQGARDYHRQKSTRFWPKKLHLIVSKLNDVFVGVGKNAPQVLFASVDLNPKGPHDLTVCPKVCVWMKKAPSPTKYLKHFLTQFLLPLNAIA